jgi:hypothetical protein
MSVTANLVGGSTGASTREKFVKACWRSLRTLLQGLVAAFPAAGPASTIVDATYWSTFGASAVVAVTAAVVSLLQNLLSIVPDPGQV